MLDEEPQTIISPSPGSLTNGNGASAAPAAGDGDLRRVLNAFYALPGEVRAEFFRIVHSETDADSQSPGGTDSVKAKSLRPIGLAEGEFVVPDDFDDPLPDELLKAFYAE